MCFSSSCRLLLTKKACLIYLSLDARLFRSAQGVLGEKAGMMSHTSHCRALLYLFFFPSSPCMCACVYVCARVRVYVVYVCACWGIFWFRLSCHCGGMCRASHMKTRCAFFAFVSSKWVNILQCVLSCFLMCTTCPFFFSLFFPPYCDDEDNNYSGFFCHEE